jgi:ABC-2 type transport system ATP-binding protein
MNASQAVEVKNLTKRFGDFTAVDGIDFSIPTGEIFGLLGPNGAGKTTTIRMLCGILLPTSGEGRVLGFDIASQAEEIKKNIGYMSQKFSLYNDLTARENIRFYGDIYGVEKNKIEKRIKELVQLAGLNEYQNSLTANLSGAWRQRLALACSIVHEPPMLFLDEPTAGVDPVSRREFWDLIYQMAGEGVTVLTTTHYMDEAEYCNTIGMMYQARMIALDNPDRLKEHRGDHPSWSFIAYRPSTRDHPEGNPRTVDQGRDQNQPAGRDPAFPGRRFHQHGFQTGAGETNGRSG